MNKACVSVVRGNWSGQVEKTLACVLLSAFVFGFTNAHAQNGPILQGMYRTMAESQAELYRQDALRGQTAGVTRVEPVPRSTSFPGQFDGQIIGPAQPSLSPPGGQYNPSVTITRPGGTLSANWFVDSLATISDNVDRLLPELQGYASSVPTAREVIGNVYQIDAEVNSLFTRTRNGEPIESVFAAYQQVDVKWRDVSYKLRASGSLDPRLASFVDTIDKTFRATDQQLGIAPPIDRVRLRDLMIVTLTYMDAMFDDVRLSPGAFGQADVLLRDGRILRERLRQESYKIDRADYNAVVASYTEFVQLWRRYAARLYQLNDAHVNQRLDSIRRQGDEVYGSLRIQAASDRGQIQYAGQRLTASLVSLQSQLSRWGSNQLPADQLRFVDTVRALVDRSQRLEAELARGSASTTAASIFTDMDSLWVSGLRSMRAIDPRSGLQVSLAQVDAIFSEVRDLLQVGPWQNQGQVLSFVASLEVATDDFNNDVQRFKRYLGPPQYRDSLAEVSDNLFATARDLHRVLDESGDLREAARLTQRLVERWQQLTPMLNDLAQSGLSQGGVDQLLQGYRQMQPLVAQAASTLLH